MKHMLNALFLATYLSFSSCAALPSIGRRTMEGGFIASCNTYEVTNHGPAYGHLQATCNLTPEDIAGEIQTTLDLSLCLANYDNTLAWADQGGAFASCTGCESRRAATRYLDCDCGTIDLNDGVYVTESGAVACFSNVGSVNKIFG